MTSQLTIITGASTGIGAGIARAALDDPTPGSAVATVSRRLGPGRHVVADLSDPATWPLVADWFDDLVTTDFDRIVFVHNAGTVDPIGFAGEIDTAEYTTNVLLNSASTQVLGSAFLATMRRLNATKEHDVPAVLMIISSGAGKNPFLGWSSYCAAKAAGDMWVRTAGIEQEARGSKTTVVAVSPGVVATDMQTEIRSSETDAFPNVERFREMFIEGELADPDEVGAKLYALSTRDDLPQGGVFGVNDEV